MDKRHQCYLTFNLLGILGITTVLLTATLSAVFAQSPNQASNQASKGPWLDKSLSPDQRADLLIEEMTLDEKVALVHGFDVWTYTAPPQWLGGAGLVPGILRLGIPDLQMTDGGPALPTLAGAVVTRPRCLARSLARRAGT